MICTITSSDHAITGVFWTKGSAFGSPTLSTGTKYVIANTGTTLQKFTSLIINSVMSIDEADYFCSAQNQDGTSISSITLHIPARKTIFYIILLLHVNEDGIQNNIPLNSYWQIFYHFTIYFEKTLYIVDYFFELLNKEFQFDYK